MIKRAIAIGYFTVRKFLLDQLDLTAGPTNLLALREGAQAYSIGSSLAHEKVLGRRRSSRPISGPMGDAPSYCIIHLENNPFLSVRGGPSLQHREQLDVMRGNGVADSPSDFRSHGGRPLYTFNVSPCIPGETTWRTPDPRRTVPDRIPRKAPRRSETPPKKCSRGSARG